jgi:hypothetical protein
MWLLKSPLDQNPRVIYQKFNGDFKSHINFGGQKEDKGMMCSITLKSIMFGAFKCGKDLIAPV